MKTSLNYNAEDVHNSIFTASDVLQFAIRLEEDGEIFYRAAADRSEKSEVKQLFNLLATEEAEHKKIFEGFLAKLPLVEPLEEDYPGEYLAHLHNYIDGRIFVPLDSKSALSESSNVATALESAIQRKMECVHYYQELKAFVPVEDHKIEERPDGHPVPTCGEKSEVEKLFPFTKAG